MEGKEMSQVLPDDLVEMIVARLPFPLIFKARGISKSWLARFSSISSLDDAREKLLATSFQNQVGELSNSWKSFCPVCIGKGKSGLHLFGYDSAAYRWQEMSSLSFFPKNFLKRMYLQLEGPLLYALPLLGFDIPDRTRIYVANILTRSWKEISPIPNIGLCDIYSQKFVSHPSSDTYKLIVFCRSCGLHMYDSRSCAWRSQQIPLHMDSDFINTSAYLNGILYMSSFHSPPSLLAFNVEDGTCDVINIDTFEGPGMMDNIMRRSHYDLVVCSGNLLMVLITTYDPLSAIVLKIDLASRKLLKVAVGPPDPVRVKGFCNWVVYDGNSIFFQIDTEYIETELWESVSYNLDTDKWTKFPVPSVFSVIKSGKIYNTRSRAKALKLEEKEQPKTVERAHHPWGATCFQNGWKPFVEV